MTGKIDIRGTTFRDAAQRHVILRGVNLGGDTKVPFAPDGRTHIPTDFAEHRDVSFVGRPAPLAEIDGHLARLRHWGFNCLRLLTTWEAVEHAGPGAYDEAYLDYLAEVCRRAGQHGLHTFVDFHQDAWSRMSGGDGAPGWTFEAAGLDFSKFAETGAAHLMQARYDPAVGGRQDSYPVMSWSGNYARPANGIMWSLFFAGADLAPGLKVEGRNVQTYLQDHYFGAMRAVAERVAHLDHVIGFDTLNEPSSGYIGAALSAPVVRYRGPIWSVLDGLALAAGSTRELPVVAPGQGVVGSERFNEAGTSIWLPGRTDPFRDAGVWDIVDGKPVALIENHFQRVGDREIEINRDYMAPFFRAAGDTIRAVRPDWLLFAEVDPFDLIKGHGFPTDAPDRTVNASHWYDISSLVTKRFAPDYLKHVLTGEERHSPSEIEDGYADEMSRIAAAASVLNGGRGSPTLLGECGIQYDMNGAEAYARWAAGERDPSIWHAQSTALTLMYNAIDRGLLSSTQWNYTVSNGNDPMIGDGWNQEDLSIWSVDQATDPDDPDSGGRGIEGFCRPYVRKAQGTIVSQRFDRESGVFEARVDVDPSIQAPTEIYVPKLQYPDGFGSDVTDGAKTEVGDQTFAVLTTAAGLLSIRVERR
ncbi:cellulase family glycosylhydrolase [Sphingomonas sp. NFX23]|uniref:cellulase family glycosylhydrolase n=1 Tax=Sphingomonas sp. NFX23 TaxID=2819532 RepID=UPI003CF4011A